MGKVVALHSGGTLDRVDQAHIGFFMGLTDKYGASEKSKADVYRAMVQEAERVKGLSLEEIRIENAMSDMKLAVLEAVANVLEQEQAPGDLHNKIVLAIAGARAANGGEQK